VILVGAMGEVEAGNIHASPQQLLNNLHCARCWPQSAHHLRSAAQEIKSKRALAQHSHALLLHHLVPWSCILKRGCLPTLRQGRAAPFC
jgi:hypothetical protein